MHCALQAWPAWCQSWRWKICAVGCQAYDGSNDNCLSVRWSCQAKACRGPCGKWWGTDFQKLESFNSQCEARWQCSLMPQEEAPYLWKYWGHNNPVAWSLLPLHNGNVLQNKKSIEWMWPRLESLEAMGKEDAQWWGDYKPLEIVHNSDLSLMWKYQECGGAAKVKKYFCHCCTLKSNNIVTQNEQPCLKWCNPDSNLPCYHQTFANNTNLQEYKKLHEQLGNVLAQQMHPLAEIWQHTWLNVNEDPQWPTHNATKSIDSIHYDIWHESVSDKQKWQYARKVTYDLILRGMLVLVSLANQQESLRAALVMEHQYWNLGNAITACDEEHTNIIALINNVPCILHLENCMGLKLFTTIIQNGLSRAVSGNLFPEIRWQESNNNDNTNNESALTKWFETNKGIGLHKSDNDNLKNKW